MLDLEDLKAKLAEYDPAAPKCPLRITHHQRDSDGYGDYDMTTHAPCCRPEGHEGECRNARQVIGWPGFVTVSALVEEVEQLRSENLKLRDVLEWVNTQCPGKCAGVCDTALRSGYHDKEKQ
jgi:hypothetical protein